MKRQPPAFKFGPYSRKQAQVVTWWMPGSPYADWDGIITDGAIRSGKTIADIDGFIEWTRASFHGEAFIVSGKSMGALKRNVLRPMFAIMSAKGIPFYYHRTDNFVECCGNTFYLFGANNEASQDVLQGLTSAGWLADEVALQPESFIEQAIGRCSVPGSKYWLNCNPESPHHHVKKELIDKAVAKRLLRLHFTMDDNLTLAPEVKARYRRMYSGVWYKRLILGLWVAAEGAVYSMFDEDIHVVGDSDIPVIVQHWVTMDYGTTNPTVFLLVGQGVDNCLYVLDEWRWDSRAKGGRSLSDAQLQEEYWKWIRSHRGVQPKYVFIDPSAASFITQLNQGGARKVRGVWPADNNVPDGIRRTSSLLTTRRLRIHKRCTGLIVEMSGYLWDAKAQAKGEDKPVKAEDHGPDALRYLVNSTRNIWARWINYEEPGRVKRAA